MTTIHSYKNNVGLLAALRSLAIALVLVVGWGLYIYNRAVSLRYETSQRTAEIRKMEVENAEVKTRYSEMTGATNTDNLVQNGSLVLEKNPQYIKSASLVMN